MLLKQGSYKRRSTRGADHLKSTAGERGVKMKILAVATLVVILCCLEVALSYPTPRFPQAKFQEKTPFKMSGKPRGISRAYLAEYNAEIEEGMFKYFVIVHLDLSNSSILQYGCLATPERIVMDTTHGLCRLTIAVTLGTSPCIITTAVSGPHASIFTGPERERERGSRFTHLEILIY